MAVFDFDPEHAPWWAFLVILGVCLGATALIMLGIWAVGDSPNRSEARLGVLPVAAGLAYAVKRLFDLPGGRPPESD